MCEKMRKIVKTHIYVVAALTCLILLTLFDGIIIHIQYDNYKAKIQMVYEMVSTKDTLMSATQILKGTKEPEKGDSSTLDYYGYDRNNNAIYKVFQKQCFSILSISGGFYCACIFVLYLIYLVERNTRKRELEKIERVLNWYKKESTPFVQSISFANKEFERIYEELCSFGDYLQLMSETIAKDKEGTKSLVTDISHQLKTPVAALKTSVEILEQEDISFDDRKEFTKRCSDQIKGIENLLEALIHISRMETGMIDIKLENAVIFNTILEAVNRVYLKAQEKEIQIEMEAEEELQELTLPHDRKWLSEAFINILENAVKYSPNHTSIRIQMMERINFLRIEIMDEGIGIPKEEYNRVFKRFYRGNSKEVKRQSGSGVGLYLSREIINRHNGSISVSAGINLKGSRFIIQIPYYS